MPYDNPDPSDPMTLVGVGLPGTDESIQDMAYVFAEEYARLGRSEEGILGLFQDPFYRSARLAYETLGQEAITKIVSECVAVWGQVRYAVREASSGQSNDSCP